MDEFCRVLLREGSLNSGAGWDKLMVEPLPSVSLSQSGVIDVRLVKQSLA
jgi:hypothetical protein